MIVFPPHLNNIKGMLRPEECETLTFSHIFIALAVPKYFALGCKRKTISLAQLSLFRNVGCAEVTRARKSSSKLDFSLAFS